MVSFRSVISRWTMFPKSLALQDPEIVRWTVSLPTPYSESDARGGIERHAER